MYEYEKVFRAFENGLLNYGSEKKPRDEIQAQIDKFKTFEARTLSDKQYFEILVFVAFYSGFKAATVTSKSKVIRKHFPNWEIVADYNSEDIDRILNDPHMIKNRSKITACVNNARTIKKLVEKYGSFKNYLDSFDALSSFENLILLKEELEAKFSYLGGITVYHFLTDIGMPVLKPDRVICRIFERLGLIENSSQLLKTVIQGRKFSEATKLPIRYIDIVFVAYGQAQSKEFGIDKGICLKNPRCDLCEVRKYCHYYGLTSQSSGLATLAADAFVTH